jgi:hypothetical protein
MNKRIADGKKNFISLPFLLFKISSPGGVKKHDRRCRAIRGFLKQMRNSRIPQANLHVSLNIQRIPVLVLLMFDTSHKFLK